MKRLIPLLLLAITCIAAIAGDEDATIKFEEQTHDFGAIKEDNGPVTHEFKFTNTGTTPLVIVTATASCGCTKPSYPKKPVAPGESGIIKVTYLPQGRPGEFSKQVTVKTNDKRNRRLKLRISGNVIPSQK